MESSTYWIWCLSVSIGLVRKNRIKNIKRLKNVLNILRGLAVFVLLASWLVNPSSVSAAETTTVSVSTPSSLGKGETFTVSISIDPGVAIAGVQFDLSFDASLVTASQVEEGDLLSQNGTGTYFNPGTIDNETGNISGVVGIIISPGQTVAKPGTFALINLTAGTENGTCPFTLSNVIVGDVTANAVSVSVVNSEVTIASDTTPPPGGGGLIGGGGSTTPAGTTVLSGKIDSDGTFLTDVIAKSADGKCVLTIEAGVKGLTHYGDALGHITILEDEESPAPPEDSSVVGLVYDISPDGATFGPTVNLTIIYDPEQLPEGITEDGLYIAYWDSSQWIALESMLDGEAKGLSAQISHFTPFTIIAPPPEAQASESPPPPPTSVPPPASFAVSDLSVTPSEIEPDEQVTISATVTNTGGSEGSYIAVLKIDGVEEGTKEVTLEAGESETITFTIMNDTVGNYTVEIDGEVGQFTVTIPASSLPPDPTPTSILTSIPAVGLSVQPTIDWQLIGSSSASFVGVAVLVICYFVWRKRFMARLS